MAEFPSVTVDLSEQLEFPGDSYPLTGKVDVAESAEELYMS